MSLTINTNVASLNAQRNLGVSQNSMNTAMQRLSSGLRINSAKDDAAGLAISDRMTSQVRGLNQAARNLNDGISMLQTAEGALQEVTNLMQRGRELAVQAANDATYSQSDKASLQAEIEQIKSEIDRIGSTTTFNGTKILDHGEGGTIAGDEDRFAIFESMKSSWLRNSEARIEEFYGLTAENVEITFAFEDDPSNGAAAYVGGPATLDANGLATSLTMTINMAHYDADSGYDYDRLIAHEMTHAVMAANMDFLNATSTKVESWFIEGTATFMSGYDDELKAAIDGVALLGDLVVALPTGYGPISTANEYASSYAATRFLHQSILDAGGSGISEMMTFMADNPGANLDDAFADLAATYSSDPLVSTWTDSEKFEFSFTDIAGSAGIDYIQSLVDDGSLDPGGDVGAIGGFDADGGEVLTNTSVISDEVQYDDDPLVGFNEVWFSEEELSLEEIASEDYAYQAGANAAQIISTNLGSVDARVLNLTDVDISTNAGAAIARFDAALEYIDEMRGNMGAVMNRLESSIANIQNVAENLSAARSRILDADIAQETSAMTKGNILQQAGVSILAQANQAPQLALSLIG